MNRPLHMCMHGCVISVSQHLNHSRGASSNAFTVFYAAATALEMPV
jgi:hypothetical protein